MNTWLNEWKEVHQIDFAMKALLKPFTPGSDTMELCIKSGNESLANLVFTVATDRNRKRILRVKDQNTFTKNFRRKRLMTLLHLFAANRFRCDSVHYLTPSEDNQKQVAAMQKAGIYRDINLGSNQIIVASIQTDKIQAFISDKNQIKNWLAKLPQTKHSA